MLRTACEEEQTSYQHKEMNSVNNIRMNLAEDPELHMRK